MFDLLSIDLDLLHLCVVEQTAAATTANMLEMYQKDSGDFHIPEPVYGFGQHIKRVP